MIRKYFSLDIIVTIIGLIGGFIYGYYLDGRQNAFSTLFIILVLILLEVSLSFDNAIVNVNVLKNMNKKRQRRFLTRGILIAVFGMRILFPIILVSIFAGITPRAAILMDLSNPTQYTEILNNAHIAIAGFGGSFLMMVGLKFFMDKNKDIDRLHKVENTMKKLGKVEAMGAAIVLLFLLGFSTLLGTEYSHEFVIAGVRGIVLYIMISGIGALMGHEEQSINLAAKTGLSSFIYLELLDASFSLDGVIGAFALSSNIFIIAIGLGIGAFFVRSFTIYMLKEGTLQSYKYLEHGAFYAVLALAIMMFLGTIIELPEAIVGSIGLFFILASLYKSRLAKENYLPRYKKLLSRLQNKLQ